MQRTRQGGAAAGTTTPISKQMQQGGSGQIFVNGSNEHGNDSIYSTPDHQSANANQTSPSHSTSASVLQKLASSRPEVGRSLENILNRVKSTPNVNDGEHPGTANESLQTPSAMTTSFSADKVSESPANGDPRMTQSFYATPGDHLGHSFNYSGADEGSQRTEYDIDGSATKSQSHYARILFNEEVPDGEANSATAALASIPGVDSNANQNRSNIVSTSNVLDISGERGHFFDHNENVNGAGAAAPNGHSGERASASDSDASSAITVIHQQKTSPHEISFDDPFR